jgi:nucleoside recognition membrane protein YjiH
MTLESIKFAFIVYGVAAIVSFLVAGVIKLIFAAVNHSNNKVGQEVKPVLMKPATQESAEI